MGKKNFVACFTERSLSFYWFAIHTFMHRMGDGAAVAEKLSLSLLPLDVVKIILSFLPAPVVLRTVAILSSSFAGIARSETYWKNLWATRLVACFLNYIQPAMHSTSSSPCTGPSSPAASCGACTVLLASVPTAKLPRVASLRADSCVTIASGDDGVTHIGLRVEPLKLPASAYTDATALAYRLAESTTSQGWAKDSGDERGGRNGVDHWQRLDHANDLLRLRKTLCFLESIEAFGVTATDRPMVDGIDSVRIFLTSHRLSSPQCQEVTAIEREAALVEFISDVVYAWECCHPSMCPDPTTRRLSFSPVEMSPLTTFFMGGEGGEEEVVATEDANNAVFFPVLSVTFGASSSFFSSPLSPLHPTTPVLIAADEVEKRRFLRYSLNDTLVYLYLLHHITFSDIHELLWNDERKCAVCSRVVSPAGYAAEFRFFVTSFFGSYPRFYVRMIFVEGNLPFTHIQETFDNMNGRSAGSLSFSGDVRPETVTLFYGGFGRVEVDIPPTASREGFEKLRTALGLGAAFPMQLLWNVVMLASGIGGSILREQQVHFGLYYQLSFTEAFEKTFAECSRGSADGQ